MNDSSVRYQGMDLFEAARDNKADEVTNLLSSGIKVNTKNEKPTAPLYYQ